MPSQVTSPRPASPAVKFAETVESLRAERAVSGFFDFMATLQSKGSYQYLRDLFQTKIELEKKCDALSEAYTTHTKMYADVQVALNAATERSREKDSELGKLKKEKADTNKKIETLEKQLRDSTEAESRLRVSLDKKNSQIEGLSKSLEENKSLVQTAKDGEKKAKVELKTCQEELNQAKLAKGKKETELNELRKFTSSMTQIPQKDIASELEAIFTSAYELAHRHFRVDLEEAILTDHVRWTHLQSHNLVGDTIPLPTTNSVIAKSMRGAAVLAVIASSLSRHIFQPTYLLDSGVELSTLMRTLAGADPTQESYLRSVLLAVLPRWQQVVVGRRIFDVVAEVMGYAGPLLSQEGEAAFRTSLEALCEQACERWSRLQRCDVKVEASLEKLYGEVDCWKLLPLQGSAAGGSDGTPRQNGTASTSGSSSRVSSPAQGRPASGLEYKDIAGVVWPSFFQIQKNAVEPIKAGFVLGAAQVKAARDEEHTGVGSTAGVRRAARQITRRSRQLTFPIMNSSGGLDRTFLSPGVGVGSNGG